MRRPRPRRGSDDDSRSGGSDDSDDDDGAGGGVEERWQRESAAATLAAATAALQMDAAARSGGGSAAAATAAAASAAALAAQQLGTAEGVPAAGAARTHNSGGVDGLRHGAAVSQPTVGGGSSSASIEQVVKEVMFTTRQRSHGLSHVPSDGSKSTAVPKKYSAAHLIEHGCEPLGVVYRAQCAAPYTTHLLALWAACAQCRGFSLSLFPLPPSSPHARAYLAHPTNLSTHTHTHARARDHPLPPHPLLCRIVPSRLRLFWHTVRTDDAFADRLAHMLNSWSGLALLLLYNSTAVLIFVINTMRFRVA